MTEGELMAELARIEAERVRSASRKALHDRRLETLSAERDRLYLGVFVLLVASVAGGSLAAFGLVHWGGGMLCFIAAFAVRAEWQRSWRATFAEHENYMGFLRAQDALSRRRP